jgi:circadian clock protein KaiB
MKGAGDMDTKDPADVTEEYERALKKGKTDRYILRLYIAGSNHQSSVAIENVKRICDKRLKGRYELEIIDIYQERPGDLNDLILAAPTLIKELPLPLRRVIGDMSREEKVLVALNLLPGT